MMLNNFQVYVATWEKNLDTNVLEFPKYSNAI